MSRRVGILVLKLAPDALAYSKSRDETWPIRFRGIETFDDGMYKVQNFWMPYYTKFINTQLFIHIR